MLTSDVLKKTGIPNKRVNVIIIKNPLSIFDRIFIIKFQLFSVKNGFDCKNSIIRVIIWMCIRDSIPYRFELYLELLKGIKAP